MKKWLFSISALLLAACSSHKSADQPQTPTNDSVVVSADSSEAHDSISPHSLPQQQELSGEVDPSKLPQRDTGIKVIREMPKPGGQGDKAVVDSLKQLKNRKKRGY